MRYSYDYALSSLSILHMSWRNFPTTTFFDKCYCFIIWTKKEANNWLMNCSAHLWCFEQIHFYGTFPSNVWLCLSHHLSNVKSQSWYDDVNFHSPVRVVTFWCALGKITEIYTIFWKKNKTLFVCELRKTFYPDEKYFTLFFFLNNLYRRCLTK